MTHLWNRLAPAAVFAAMLLGSAAHAQDLATPDVSEFTTRYTLNRGRIFGGAVGETQLTVRLTIENWAVWEQQGDPNEFNYVDPGFKWFIEVMGPPTGNNPTGKIKFQGVSVECRVSPDRSTGFFSKTILQAGRFQNVEAHCWLLLSSRDFAMPAVNPRNTFPVSLSHWDEAILFIQVFPPNYQDANELFVNLTGQTRPATGAGGEPCDLTTVESRLAAIEGALPGLATAADLGPLASDLAALQADMALVKNDLAKILRCLETTVCPPAPLPEEPPGEPDRSE